jgi:GST-like protein
MIDLHDWPTLNDLKITLFLEEAGLDYAIKPVNIGKGEQFEAAFLAISPNNRVPAIVGHAPRDGGAPFSVFESGAILRYLADKTARFGGSDACTRVVVDEWLAWQVGGLGPMTGQYGHFTVYAPEKIAYEGSAAPARRARPPSRGSRVHRRRRVQHRRHGHLSVDQPVRDGAARSRAVRRGAPLHVAIAARPATQRAYARGPEVSPGAGKPLDAEQRRHLFGR